MVQWAKNPPYNSGYEDSDSIPGWGTKVPPAKEELSLRSEIRVRASQQKIPRDTTKTRGSPINQLLKKIRKGGGSARRL